VSIRVYSGVFLRCERGANKRIGPQCDTSNSGGFSIDHIGKCPDSDYDLRFAVC